MIEVLVVVAITLIVTAIAIPSVVKSMQGQRLRSSARLLVTSHKYARNMAVLRQSRMAVLVDRINRRIQVVAAGGASRTDQDMFLETQARAEERGEPAADEEGEQAPSGMSVEETSSLSGDIEITGFESESDIRERDGVYWVNYYPSGMSDGFEVTLADSDGRSAQVKADRISGLAEVEYDD